MRTGAGFKLNPTRLQFIWRVETTAIEIPKALLKHAVPGFTREPTVLWTRQRKIAEQIGEADEQAGGQPRLSRFAARRCPRCRRWWIGDVAHIQHEFEALSWLSGKPVPPCNSTCNNARAMAELLSSPSLMLSFFRDPELVAKAILNLPIEFEFSSAASGAKVGSHGGKQATDSCDSLDVRLLLRAKHLTPGAQFRFGCVQGQTTDSTVIVSYTPFGSASAIPSPQHEIQLLSTSCNFGGERKWLRCPAEGCGRRVEVLYWRGDIFACRHCCQLVYRSQREEPALQKLRRAQAIRVRLGGSRDVKVPFPAKPKGMYRLTYQRLQEQHDSLLRRALGDEAAALFGSRGTRQYAGD